MATISLNQIIFLHNELMILDTADDQLLEELQQLEIKFDVSYHLQKKEKFKEKLRNLDHTAYNIQDAEKQKEIFLVLLVSALRMDSQTTLVIHVLRRFLKNAFSSSKLREASMLVLSSLIPILERFLLRGNRNIIIEGTAKAKQMDKKMNIVGSFSELLEDSMRKTDKELLEQEQQDYQNIEKAYDYYRKQSMLRGKDKLVGLLNAYIVKYSALDNAIYRDKVDTIIQTIGNRKREMIKADIVKNIKGMNYQRAAMVLYKEMVLAIKKGDLEDFVVALAIYTRITGPYPEAPFKKEVDDLERLIYPIIEEKGLWNTLTYA